MRPFFFSSEITSRLLRGISEIADGDSIVNPHAAVSIAPEPTGVHFGIKCPVRGEPLRFSRVEPDRSGLHHLLSGVLLNNRPEGVVSPLLLEDLRRTGLLLSPQYVPKHVNFFELQKDGDAEGASLETSDLVLNRRCTIERAPELPGGITDFFGSARPLFGKVVWVEDPARGLSLPYALGEPEADVLTGLLIGETSLTNLDAKTLLSFTQKGILYEAGGSHEWRKQWGATIDQARNSLWQDGFGILKGFVPATFLGILQRYYKSLLSEGYLMLDDGQSYRYYWHNEPIAAVLHHRASAIVARCVDAVKPSYAYSAIYKAGAALGRHTDREQCEYTVSVTFDTEPDSYIWPLYIVTRDERPVEVALRPGDAVIFKGRVLPHFRERLGGCTVGVLLLHYVPPAFDGRLQ
jgi:hypothetical protein